MRNDKVYVLTGNTGTDQAQSSTANPRGGDTEMRILIELQVISILLHGIGGLTDDLARIRQDVADSI